MDARSRPSRSRPKSNVIAAVPSPSMIFRVVLILGRVALSAAVNGLGERRGDRLCLLAFLCYGAALRGRTAPKPG